MKPDADLRCPDRRGKWEKTMAVVKGFPTSCFDVWHLLTFITHCIVKIEGKQLIDIVRRYKVNYYVKSTIQICVAFF